MPEVQPLGHASRLEWVELGVFDPPCKVISASALIAVKLHVARPKDLEAVRELRAVADRKNSVYLILSSSMSKTSMPAGFPAWPL